MALYNKNMISKIWRAPLQYLIIKTNNYLANNNEFEL